MPHLSKVQDGHCSQIRIFITTASELGARIPPPVPVPNENKRLSQNFDVKVDVQRDKLTNRHDKKSISSGGICKQLRSR